MPPPFIAVDPGSHRIGFTVMHNGKLLDGGVIRGPTRADSMQRIDIIAQELGEVAGKAKKQHGIVVAVLEVTSGHMHGRFQNRRMQGLQTLGAAVIKCRDTLVALGLEVVLVKENTWTRCQPKKKRHALVEYAFPELAAAFAKDKGGDWRDSIGLARWYEAFQEIREWPDGNGSAQGSWWSMDAKVGPKRSRSKRQLPTTSSTKSPPRTRTPKASSRRFVGGPGTDPTSTPPNP
jgi:hypothetical protein